MVDVWQTLDEAPDYASCVADLYDWSTNYDSGEGPFVLFLDIIGWSADKFGSALYNLDEVHQTPGYLEVSKLAAALNEYADRPDDVREYVDLLMTAEMGDFGLWQRDFGLWRQHEEED